MSGQRTDWWNEETIRDKLLRELAVKAKELGRLPTSKEISDDPKLPSPGQLVISAGASNLEELLREVATMLYKRGCAQTCPVELTPAELAKGSTERARLEREYRAYYKKQLRRVMEQGGVLKLRRERIRQRFEKCDTVRVVETPKGANRPKARWCRSKEQALEALVNVYRQFGKVTQSAVVAYAREHKGSGTPAVPTVKKFLGPSKTWTQQVEEYLARDRR